MKKSWGCWPSMMGLPKAVSPCWKSSGYWRAVMVAGSSENMARRVSWPRPSWRMAMGMSQLVEKNLSPPRVTGDRQGTLNCSQVAGEGPVGFPAACCWVSVMKAVPWSMSIQPAWWDMIIDVGVDAGSMLVPELVWLSSVSMRVVGGFIMSMFMEVMFIGAAGVFCAVGICMEGMSIPGMSGMGGCLVCAWKGSAANKTSGSNVVACLWGMVIPSLEDCVGRQTSVWRTL